MNKIHRISTGLFQAVLIVSVLISCRAPFSETHGWNEVPGILNRIVPPVFQDMDFKITSYGGIGDGKADCTEAFRLAIKDCHERGGGRVIVPTGVFLTGAIHLKSNVNLYVQEGGTILFSQDVRHYLPVVFTRFEGIELMNYSPFIYAFEEENIAITGEGTLDGQADSTAWWPWTGSIRHGWKPGQASQQEDRDRLFGMAEENIPVSKRVFGEGHFLRVNFIQFYRCKNVLIEGIQIKRSPMWEIHPVLSENITVRNVHIMSHGPNNDGCNPESCRDVLIGHCYFDTGDDCIAIKSGRNGDGRRIQVPSENIIIQGCEMKDGHGGVVIGSEISGSCRNIFTEDCIMDSPNLDRALRIKTNSLRGGVVENIFMRNVRIGEVREAVLHVYFHYETGDSGAYTPVVRNIVMENVTSQKSRFALYLDGYKRSPISNIRLTNCEFNGVTEINGNFINHVKKLKFENVTINGIKQ